jgi:NAD+ kinase
MAEVSQASAQAAGPPDRVRRLGVVVHPVRVIDGPLRALTGWAERHGAEVVQIPVPGQEREVATPGSAADCDLIVSIGGDGTMLAALRAALAVGRPALGLACGSLGVLTGVEAGGLGDALERFSRREWTPWHLPALAISGGSAGDLLALNDMAVVRAGIGQVRVTMSVDGILFSRLAGDGCIVSTPLGSSAYAMAAGSALMTPGTDAYLLTPLPAHGGSRQPLVISAGSELRLEITPGIGGARLEVDGQAADTDPRDLSVRLRREVATLVTFSGQESLFASLRRRQIIVDSPRILADDSAG